MMCSGIQCQRPSRKLAPRSAYRYTPIDEFIEQAETIAMPDGVLYRQGNEQVYAHKGPPPVPQRASRGASRVTTAQYAIPEHAASLGDRARRARTARRFHWLWFVGITLLIMVSGYALFGAIGTWWTNHQNDATYGYPRTYQCSAVVGHGDSAANPSRFIAENLYGHIIIIEIPGGNVSKAIIYSGPTMVGPGQDLIPVTLSFADVNGDGRLDMLVHIEGQTLVFLNTGEKFTPPAGGE